jgi:hypothetical protein
MSGLKKTVLVQKTVYPFDYKKNDSDEEFNEWALHIRNEVIKHSSPEERLVINARDIIYNRTIK